MSDPIIVTATDAQTGETGRQELHPGEYCLIVVDPLYLDGKQVYGNGTVVLTLKRRPPETAGGGQA